MIKILSAAQLKEADAYTIAHEPISSIALMERASETFVSALYSRISGLDSAYIFCGYGNNGGDGLAIARILSFKSYDIKVFTLADTRNYSADMLANLASLENVRKDAIHFLHSEKDFPTIPNHSLIVDALFGSGLNKPLGGLAEKLVAYLNKQSGLKISVDIPSGLFSDQPTDGTVFNADYTITFQFPKLSFLFPENATAVGNWTAVDIGINQNFIQQSDCSRFLLEEADIRKIIKPRRKFDHKGKFGHAFIHAGSAGKMGAAILCSAACTRTGAGLTTAHIPNGNASTINAAYPEVMSEEYAVSKKISKADVEKYSAFAFGPGIGTGVEAAKLLFSLLKKIDIPVVLDADAITLLSKDLNKWKLVPSNSILTPHPKEFERIAGKTANWYDRLQRQLSLSKEHQVYIVLKGAYSCITSPDGNAYFNPTGNPGMAKGGSGDVLTGMIVALLAQGYSAEECCLLGVYLHGLAADLAVQKHSEYSLLATDIVNSIGDAYNKILSE